MNAVFTIEVRDDHQEHSNRAALCAALEAAMEQSKKRVRPKAYRVTVEPWRPGMEESK